MKVKKKRERERNLSASLINFLVVLFPKRFFSNWIRVVRPLAVQRAGAPACFSKMLLPSNACNQLGVWKSTSYKSLWRAHVQPIIWSENRRWGEGLTSFHHSSGWEACRQKQPGRWWWLCRLLWAETDSLDSPWNSSYLFARSKQCS